MSEKTITTRIAPSPTGNFHIGTARTALFNFLFARKMHGKFFLRIEDTDKERSKKEYEQDIIESLSWLSLTYDELYRQSDRLPSHKQAIEKMLKDESAYLSKEKSVTDPKRIVEVVRLKNPNKKIKFTDLIRGEITFDTSELKDFVIARSVDDPLYHLGAVVDDAEMHVTHVIRGEDHISNTPRQILIQEALGYERPHYAHIPLILAEDRSKLSKRSEATSIHEYRESGYLPEALINFLAFLGWNPGTEQELFTIDELIQVFSIEKIQKGGAVFNVDKLKWFNAEYIQKLTPESLIKELEHYMPEHTKKQTQYSKERLLKASRAIVERIRTFKEVTELAQAGELDYYFSTPLYKRDLLLPKEEASHQKVAEYLENIKTELEKLSEERFNTQEIKEAVWEYASTTGRALVLSPMRVALSGKERSPDPFTLSEIFGKQETLARLNQAQKLLRQ